MPRRGTKSSKVNSICAFCAFLCLLCPLISAQETRNLTPSQAEIEKQRQRLSSADDEERRDAVMRLGSMHRPEASRAALPALSDASSIVRATAAKAIHSVGAEESVSSLLPLLNDKDEFVRREAAYALGLTRSSAATTALSDRLLNDKEDGVQAAAAVALGHIADEAAVVALVGTLAPQLSAPANKKRKPEVNAFVQIPLVLMEPSTEGQNAELSYKVSVKVTRLMPQSFTSGYCCPTRVAMVSISA